MYTTTSVLPSPPPCAEVSPSAVYGAYGVYSIKRWDSVDRRTCTQTADETAYPVLYFNPDENGVHGGREICRQYNSYLVPIMIHGSGSAYDEYAVMARLTRARDVYTTPRPNFEHQTGWVALEVQTPWIGFPMELGLVSILFPTSNATAVRAPDYSESIPDPFSLQRSAPAYTSFEPPACMPNL